MGSGVGEPLLDVGETVGIGVGFPGSADGRGVGCAMRPVGSLVGTAVSVGAALTPI